MSEIELKHLEEKLEGLLIKAVQSGKKETSALVDSIIQKQDNHIHTGIEKYVNGHLKDVKVQLENHSVTLQEIKKEVESVKAEQVTVREKLEKVEPIIDGRKTIVNVTKFLLWMSGVFVAISSIVYIIIKFFKYMQTL